MMFQRKMKTEPERPVGLEAKELETAKPRLAVVSTDLEGFRLQPQRSSPCFYVCFDHVRFIVQVHV